MAYIPRVVDAELASRLAAMGAVVIEGPKACGKTVTAREVAQSEVLLDIDEAAKAAAAVDPALLLPGDPPRLLDEWHVAPALWNLVRREVDKRGLPGQFILTGSAVPADDDSRHTGAGRMTRMRMRPMSLYETGRSNGEISLAQLLEGQPSQAGDSGLTVPDLAEEIAMGGWPGIRGLSAADARLAVIGYLDEVRRVDINNVDGIRRDPVRVLALMRSLARNVATQAAATVLAADTGGADGPLKDDTVRSYLSALDRLMIVEDQPAWAPHLRSKHLLRSAPKRHFVDPSLAVAALRASPDRLLKDLNHFGFLFESLVVRDLRVYAQANDAQVLHYRDNKDLEVDAIVEQASGCWAAFEVKLGVGQIDAAAGSLLKFVNRVDTAACGEPAVLGVIAGTGYGYVRKDGVHVIPIGALAP